MFFIRVPLKYDSNIIA